MPGPWSRLNQHFRNRVASWTRTPIAWDGLNGEPYTPQPNTPWIRPSQVDVARARQAMVASGLFTIEGFYDVQCFFPQGTGQHEVDSICDELAALFRDYETGEVQFWEPERFTVGVDPEGWFQVNVMLNFTMLAHTPDAPSEEVWSMVFSQSSHGLSKGDAVYASASGYAKAQASSTATVAGALITAVNGDEFVAVSGGYATITNHGYTVGARLYLSTATAGVLTSTLPTALVQEVASVVDANTLELHFKLHTT